MEVAADSTAMLARLIIFPITPPAASVRLEVQLQSYLHHPVRERVVDYARAGAPNSNDGSSAQIEISVISRVEHFPP